MLLRLVPLSILFLAGLFSNRKETEGSNRVMHHLVCALSLRSAVLRPLRFGCGAPLFATPRKQSTITSATTHSETERGTVA